MMAHVLIVEDDATMLRGLSDNFQAAGYDVTTANEGRAGLAAALNSAVDIVILDLMLPGMNGYEICQELRRRKVEVPIIMLTAKGQEEDVVRGLNVGADDYVVKPFSIRELLARSGAFLRRRGQAASEQYEFADFVLDLRAHVLRSGDREVPLTSKEFRLLEFLVTNAGRALTRREILNAVWGNNIVVTDRSVDRCVTTLRAKIEQHPGEPRFIRTIRDIGYRFEFS